MKIFLVGGGGRESALGSRIVESSTLYVLSPHINPSLDRAAAASGGCLVQGDICDPATVVKTAREFRVDLALVSSDGPIAAGVVDGLLKEGIPTVGATRAAGEIEWNKAYARQVLDFVAPSVNPRYRIAKTPEELDTGLAELGDIPVVVKPRGLTGGKGVKVMGHHLDTHADAREYAAHLLSNGDNPIIEERIDGIEFTINSITDGSRIFFPPATYDYPFRYKGDVGPGTGGMGSFSCRDGLFPFLSQAEYDQACTIMQNVVDYLRDNGRPFSGIFHGSFFISDRGITVIEFNARFGDPECINIISLLDTDLTYVLEKLSASIFDPSIVKLRDKASIVVYLVAPLYPRVGGGHNCYNVDIPTAKKLQTDVYFSSSVARAAKYCVTGSSRAVAFAATDTELPAARDRVYDAIKRAVIGELDYRPDVAADEYIEHLVSRRCAWR